MSEAADNYLRDVGRLLLELAKEAKQRAQKEHGSYEKGEQMAFYAVLSLMKQQAVAFGLTEDAIGLDAVNLEREVL